MPEIGRIEFHSNEELVRNAEKLAIRRALFAMGVMGVEGAVESISGENLAVDTGRLRASISFVTAEGESGGSSETSTNEQPGDKLSGSAPRGSVQIGTNVNYAEYIETGTSRMAARPFLHDGIEAKIPEMERRVQDILEGKE